ncbi:MAG: sel1 repeat family protein [Rhodobiaceae bacterium]|nr:sel1 repeat family protein [Rhodobiaceae bacterium]MCC0016437.1 sel1 repeat family protein [Rhodobiaceae bacterium]MCC0041535.1 sel1 repeat family protein [Rhodobiaceae bacterium]MCC0052774.1 sel1 repeat family protein [Rhodobiaceae bacterium]
MLTSKRLIAGAFALGLAVLLSPAAVHASGEQPELTDDIGPVKAFRIGARAYLSGDFLYALKALEHAAKRGHAMAMWKLGKMYAEGDGVAEDDQRAFDYFREIANAHADDNPHSQFASVYSNAFVQLGNYYKSGIPGTKVPQNYGEAARMYMHAATYFGDPDAQYQLARMYLDGNGVPRDPAQSVRWLYAAAKKQHVGAQALLGDLLISGADVHPRPVEGLKWLLIAKDRAGPADRDWVLALHFKAMQATTQDEQVQAQVAASAWESDPQ